MDRDELDAIRADFAKFKEEHPWTVMRINLTHHLDKLSDDELQILLDAVTEEKNRRGPFHLTSHVEIAAAIRTGYSGDLSRLEAILAAPKASTDDQVPNRAREKPAESLELRLFYKILGWMRHRLS